MSLNEYNFANTRVLNKLEIKNKYHSELTLGGYEELLTKLEILNQKLDIESITHESSNEVVELRNHTTPSAHRKQKQIVEKNNEQVEQPKSTIT